MMTFLTLKILPVLLCFLEGAIATRTDFSNLGRTQVRVSTSGASSLASRKCYKHMPCRKIGDLAQGKLGYSHRFIPTPVCSRKVRVEFTKDKSGNYNPYLRVPSVFTVHKEYLHNQRMHDDSSKMKLSFQKDDYVRIAGCCIRDKKGNLRPKLEGAVKDHPFTVKNCNDKDFDEDEEVEVAEHVVFDERKAQEGSNEVEMEWKGGQLVPVQNQTTVEDLEEVEEDGDKQKGEPLDVEEETADPSEKSFLLAEEKDIFFSGTDEHGTDAHRKSTAHMAQPSVFSGLAALFALILVQALHRR